MSGEASGVDSAAARNGQRARRGGGAAPVRCGRDCLPAVSPARSACVAHTLDVSGLSCTGGSMLRRAENASVSFVRSLLGSKGRMYIRIGRITFRSNRVDQSAFDESQEIQRREPRQLIIDGERT